MLKELTREMLWEAGTQFGHQSKKWNPKMKQYIYGKKNNVHIIDLQQTIWCLNDVKKFLFSFIALKKGKILFVGTKKQAKLVVKDVAEKTGNFYVNQRWLGGTLTNLKTIQLRIKRLWNIEHQEKNGNLKILPKKEQILIYKEKIKLEKFLNGIKFMKELPDVLFVVDPKEEYIAINEAKKLKIPIIAICDTNVDPENIDYVIPGNDDTIRSISILTNYVASLYCESINMKIPDFQNRILENKKEDSYYNFRKENLKNKLNNKKNFLLDKDKEKKIIKNNNETIENKEKKELINNNEIIENKEKKIIKNNNEIIENKEKKELINNNEIIENKEKKELINNNEKVKNKEKKIIKNNNEIIENKEKKEELIDKNKIIKNKEKKELINNIKIKNKKNINNINHLLEKIDIIDNNLEKTLLKLKNIDLEKICLEFNIKKNKKNIMVNSLKELLVIENNFILKK